MEMSGNSISNAIYEGLLKAEERPTSGSEDHEAQAEFVKSKYQRLDFFCRKTYESQDSWFTQFYNEVQYNNNNDSNPGASSHLRSFVDYLTAGTDPIPREISVTITSIEPQPWNPSFPPYDDNEYGNDDLGCGDGDSDNKTASDALDLGYGPMDNSTTARAGVVDEGLARELASRAVGRHSLGRRESMGQSSRRSSNGAQGRRGSLGQRRKSSLGRQVSYGSAVMTAPLHPVAKRLSTSNKAPTTLEQLGYESGHGHRSPQKKQSKGRRRSSMGAGFPDQDLGYGSISHHHHHHHHGHSHHQSWNQRRRFSVGAINNNQRNTTPPPPRGGRRSSMSAVIHPHHHEDEMGNSSSGQRIRRNLSFKVSNQRQRRSSAGGHSGGGGGGGTGATTTARYAAVEEEKQQHCRGFISPEIEHQRQCRRSFRRYNSSICAISYDDDNNNDHKVERDPGNQEEQSAMLVITTKAM